MPEEILPDHDANGNIPYEPKKIYRPSFEEFENRFVDKFPYSNTRHEIIVEYKIHCNEVISHEIVNKQWINGSYITIKENPSDIDMLFEVDGTELDNRNLKKKMDDIIGNALSTSNLRCDSHYISKYPEDEPDLFQDYMDAKIKFLCMLWNSDRDYNLKGIIEFDVSTLEMF